MGVVMGRTLAGLVLIVTLTGCEAPTRPAASTPPPAALGSEVRDGKFAFVVSEVGPPPHWYGLPPRGQWVLATMTIRNIGDGPQTFSVGNVQLIDSGGRAYAPTTPPSFVNPGGSFQVDLNPGFDASASVMFDVPPGTAVSAVEVHDSALSGGARVTVG